MTVDFVKLKRHYDLYAKEYEEAVLRAMRSGWYILGNELVSFENQFAEYTGASFCIGVNSGLDALILAVRALDIGPGDEVIVPSNTYIASVLGITENGATPIFVEPDQYFCMDPYKIESAITPQTKAILPVHLYGQAADMEKIMQIADCNGLYVIEDCAQSHGARQRGKLTGTFGTIGCFSFYPTKPMGALGDAGALITDDASIAQKLRMLRNYGSGTKYINQYTGTNSRLDELQAAVLKVSLSHLENGIKARQSIASRYLNEIRNPLISLPGIRNNSNHVYHVFGILCSQRDALKSYLDGKGIRTLIHYPIPPHLQECYASLGYKEGSFPISEKYAAEELSLPIYEGMPDEEVTYIIDTINGFQGN